MSKPTRFSLQLGLGLAALILLLVAGSVFAALRLLSAIDRRDLVSQEHAFELASVERLRGNSERLGSAARGYLLTGDEDLLVEVGDAEHGFSELISSLARQSDAAELQQVFELAASAEAYLADLSRLITERQRSNTSSVVGLEFEATVLPRRVALSREIDEYVQSRSQALLRAEEERQERAFEALLISAATLVLSIALGAMFAVLFGRKIASAYHSEQRALAVAERAVAAREELLAMVAHDLRNPLSAIAIRADILKRGVQTERAHELALGISRVAHTMALLVGNLVDASSVEAGRFVIKRTRCSALDLLHRAMEVVRDLALEKRLEVRLDDRAEEAWFSGDPDRLVQVLINLGGNAVKFTPPGGRVVFSAALDDDDVVFVVSDTGRGIPQHEQAKVFSRFWTAERNGQLGSGLGLYISKGIVEAHGGSIEVRSQEGQGAEFRFRVPRLAPAHAAEPLPGLGAEPFGPGNLQG